MKASESKTHPTSCPPCEAPSVTSTYRHRIRSKARMNSEREVSTSEFFHKILLFILGYPFTQPHESQYLRKTILSIVPSGLHSATIITDIHCSCPEFRYLVPSIQWAIKLRSMQGLFRTTASVLGMLRKCPFVKRFVAPAQ